MNSSTLIDMTRPSRDLQERWKEISLVTNLSMEAAKFGRPATHRSSAKMYSSPKNEPFCNNKCWGLKWRIKSAERLSWYIFRRFSSNTITLLLSSIVAFFLENRSFLTSNSFYPPRALLSLALSLVSYSNSPSKIMNKRLPSGVFMNLSMFWAQGCTLSQPFRTFSYFTDYKSFRAFFLDQDWKTGRSHMTSVNLSNLQFSISLRAFSKSNLFNLHIKTSMVDSFFYSGWSARFSIWLSLKRINCLHRYGLNSVNIPFWLIESPGHK